MWDLRIVYSDKIPIFVYDLTEMSMKKLFLCMLMGCFACVPLRAVYAQQPDSLSERTLPRDTPGFRMIPNRNMEVTDAYGRVYRLTPVGRPLGPQHSLSLEIGAYAACVDQPLFFRDGGCCDYDYWLWPGEYPGERRYYEGPGRFTGGIGLSYGYRVARWFETGVSLTYAGYFQNLYNSSDGSIASRARTHYVTLMPYARFSWLNSRTVRLYSSLHLGVQWGSQQSYFDSADKSFFLAAQFSPFGIRVGRRLFGYAELGIGMRGVVICGIGYVFGDKSKK